MSNKPRFVFDVPNHVRRSIQRAQNQVQEMLLAFSDALEQIQRWDAQTPQAEWDELRHQLYTRWQALHAALQQLRTHTQQWNLEPEMLQDPKQRDLLRHELYHPTP